ncbi:MAG: hypothetical protein JWP37_1543 [Mucilaginibacter sp.]|nr:hypothetical protein [Mucilaginibacter sp.]
MIRSNFQLMFKVEVLHSYFEHGICNCLRFKPGATTSGLLKRFDFRIRNKINGFDFYTNSRNTITAFLKYIQTSTNQTFFDFEIESNNSNFHLFTELPVDWVGQLVYYSQADTNVYQEGVVELDQSLSENVNATSLGNLTLHFDDIIKFGIDNGYAQFAINYKARSTQWQYFVINKSSIQLNNPAIGGKADIGFNGPENVTIENGERAILFTSGDNLIPLSEVPTYKFDLVNRPALNGNDPPKRTSAPKIIFRGLPNPDPKRIGIVNINSINQVSSPIYVYV